MRQKKILLTMALLLFVILFANAYAVDFQATNLYRFNNVYDPIAFPTAPATGQQNMQIAALISPDPYPVYFQFNPAAPEYNPALSKYSMTYLPQWSNLPYYPTVSIYVVSFPFGSPWVNQNAVLFIDTNTNGAYDSGEPLNYILPRPSGTYNLLPAVQNVQITDGIYPTITWDFLPEAERYRVGILGFDANGNPNLGDLKFLTDFLTSNSYTYSGSLLQLGQSYAFFVEARNYLNDDVSNPLLNLASQSRYLTEYTPVPEPSTMILFGSGLIGLVGYGRKKFLKK